MRRKELEPAQRDRGQALVLFAISLIAIIMGVGLVIDGGTALSQRRASQNAADLAALAGARVVAEKISGDTVNGTDASVVAAINATVAANGGQPVAYGSANNGPQYMNQNGASTGWVGGGSIPANTVGVKLNSTRTWNPYLLGLVGMRNWSATAEATARGGYAAGGPGGNVFPAGVAEAFFNGKTPCGQAALSNTPGDPCAPQQLTPGNLNVPGGFGWLKFGCEGPNSGGLPFGLGQVAPANNGGCQNNKPFLQTEIGPPPNSYGCCSAVGTAGSGDDIGSLPGNKASADCTYYINAGVTVIVPVWDQAFGTGQNAYYHIVGFTGWQITGCNGGKDLEGVWRQPIWNGPTTQTPGFAGAPLAVQLIH
ncbi:MAG TPA: pilus assembly protein TadG-related protein [Candidatus Dormibacteraeota bacterium]|nr:pilus assembly protein TadG-related protein [Candidatus Dormibacteraeota bacterium]